MPRKDDAQSRGRVFAARRLIYEKNISVDSKTIENLLKQTSQVPTIVSHVPIFPIFFWSKPSLRNDRMPFPTACHLLASTCFQ